MFEIAELDEVRQSGFCMKPQVIERASVRRLRRAASDLLEETGEHIFLEANGHDIRAVYGLHRRSGIWQELAARDDFVSAARAIVGDDVYVYQYKVNPKSPRSGDAWEWHQDFPYWEQEDGVPARRLVNFAVFLDDVTIDNGPLAFIPGSHTGDYTTTNDGHAGTSATSGEWGPLVSARLRYTVPAERMASLREAVTPVGEAGSVVVFDANIVHGSGPNNSEAPRWLVLLTYNAVSNAPPTDRPRRPWFFLNYDTQPIVASAD